VELTIVRTLAALEQPAVGAGAAEVDHASLDEVTDRVDYDAERRRLVGRRQVRQGRNEEVGRKVEPASYGAPGGTCT
jgi:hypothetical protein